MSQVRTVENQDYNEFIWEGMMGERAIPENAGFVKNKILKRWSTESYWNLKKIAPFVDLDKAAAECVDLYEKMYLDSSEITISESYKEQVDWMIPKSISLRDFQYVPAFYASMYSKNNLFIGDDPGCGKTFAALLQLKQMLGKNTTDRVLILCPANKVLDWKRDCEIWGIDVDRLSVFSIDTWKGIDNDLREWKIQNNIFSRVTVIMDEIHLFKNPDSLRTKHTLPLLNAFSQTISLSGSMPPNYSCDLHPYLKNLIPYVAEDKSYTDFRKKYCVVRKKKVGIRNVSFPVGNRNEDELHWNLRTNGMVRRTFEACHPQIPEPIVRMVVIPESYIDGQTRAMLRIEIKDVRTLNPMNWITLQRLASSRKRLANAKVEGNVQIVREYLLANPSKQVIVLAIHTEAIDRMVEILRTWYKIECITGSVSAQRRQDLKEAFLEKRYQIIVGNMQAMGESLDFQTASYILFAEPDWTPKTHKQGIGRAYRFGQTDQLLVEFSVVENSLDCRVLSTALKKESSIRRIQDAIERV